MNRKSSIHSLRLILTLLLFAVSVEPQTAPSSNKDAKSDATLCAKDASVRLNYQETKEQAINRVAPKFPPLCRCQGTIIVAVRVDQEGKVDCAAVLNGHPLLRAPSLHAAQQWTFKPLLKDGAAVAFAGFLSFTFKDGEVTF